MDTWADYKKQKRTLYKTQSSNIRTESIKRTAWMMEKMCISLLCLTCLGRAGFTSSTLLVFILVFISCRCWRTALSLGPSHVVSLLGFRMAGISLTPCSGGGSTASPADVETQCKIHQNLNVRIPNFYCVITFKSKLGQERTQGHFDRRIGC